MASAGSDQAGPDLPVNIKLLIAGGFGAWRKANGPLEAPAAKPKFT